MHDDVQWLIRSSKKYAESTAFSHLATKIGKEPGIKRVADRSVQSFIGLKAYKNELENTINNCFG
jgi:hypothetical protein